MSHTLRVMLAAYEDQRQLMIFPHKNKPLEDWDDVIEKSPTPPFDFDEFYD